MTVFPHPFSHILSLDLSADSSPQPISVHLMAAQNKTSFHYARYDSNGEWTGTYVQCPNKDKKEVDKQIRLGLWKTADFPEPRPPLREAVARVIMTQRRRRQLAHEVIWKGSFRRDLVNMSKRDSLGMYSLNKWPHHLLAGNLSNLQLDDQMVTQTLSFLDTRPILFTKQPQQLGTPWHTTAAYLKFSPVLALIFSLPGIQKDRPLCEPLEEEQLKALYLFIYLFIF